MSNYYVEKKIIVDETYYRLPDDCITTTATDGPTVWYLTDILNNTRDFQPAYLSGELSEDYFTLPTTESGMP